MNSDTLWILIIVGSCLPGFVYAMRRALSGKDPDA